VRVLSPRVIQYATRNHSAERADGPTGIAMHRGWSPAIGGTSPTVRGLGTIASPSTFGHGGAGSSYSWGDPESGLSFSYLSNARLDGDWHNRRLDQVSSLVHSALVEL
jgi:CubicO group peptidase (beta-lactamase class C family)